MFDLLRPITKLAYVTAFIAFFVAANAALLYALSACTNDVGCIGTGGAAEIITKVRTIAGIFLPGNFFACVQFMVMAMLARRAYDYAVKVMTVVTAAS